MQTESTRSNDDRAERALKAVEGYIEFPNELPDLEANLIDLAVDLLHLADRMPGHSAAKIHFDSVMHYTADKWGDELGTGW